MGRGPPVTPQQPHLNFIIILRVHEYIEIALFLSCDHVTLKAQELKGNLR